MRRRSWAAARDRRIREVGARDRNVVHEAHIGRTKDGGEWTRHGRKKYKEVETTSRALASDGGWRHFQLHSGGAASTSLACLYPRSVAAGGEEAGWRAVENSRVANGRGDASSNLQYTAFAWGARMAACTDCGFPAQGGRDGYCDDQEVPRHPWFRLIRGTQKTKTKKMESGSPSRTRLETVPRRIDNVGEASSTAKNARSRPARGLLCLASYGNLPFWDCKSGVAPGLEEESDRIEKKSGEQAYQRALADSGKCKHAFFPSKLGILPEERFSRSVDMRASCALHVRARGRHRRARHGTAPYSLTEKIVRACVPRSSESRHPGGG